MPGTEGLFSYRAGVVYGMRGLVELLMEWV